MARRIEIMRKVLVWHLRMHTIPSIILKSYSTVELNKVKTMLGAKQLPAEEFKKLIDDTNLLESDKPDSKGFVNVSNIELV